MAGFNKSLLYADHVLFLVIAYRHVVLLSRYSLKHTILNGPAHWAIMLGHILAARMLILQSERFPLNILGNRLFEVIL